MLQTLTRKPPHFIAYLNTSNTQYRGHHTVEQLTAVRGVVHNNMAKVKSNTLTATSE